MSITIELTPNPRSLAFKPNVPVASTPMQVNPATADQTAPLANVLYKVFADKIDAIFLSKTAVIIRLYRAEDWTSTVGTDTLRNKLAGAIEAFAASGKPFAIAPAVLAVAALASGNGMATPAFGGDDDTVDDIKDILDRYVNADTSKITKDGGQAIFHDYNSASQELSLRMIGSCGGCPGSVATLEHNVMALFKHYGIPVTRIINLNPEPPTPKLANLPLAVPAPER